MSPNKTKQEGWPREAQSGWYQEIEELRRDSGASINAARSASLPSSNYCAAVITNPSNQTLPPRRLSNFLLGSRWTVTRTRSELAVNGILRSCQYVVPTCFSEDWP